MRRRHLPNPPRVRRQTLPLLALLQILLLVIVVFSGSARSSTTLPTRQHFLAQGSVFAGTVYDSSGTEVYPAGATSGDKHGTIRWEAGGKYANNRTTYALLGMRLVKGNPGRIFNFHTQPADAPWEWDPPTCAGGSSSNAVSPVAIDYFDTRGLELVVQPEKYCGGSGNYHYQIMSPAEIESKRGQWIYIWLEVIWGRVDGSTPNPGGVRVWVAGEDTPRVDRQGINTHWYEEGMVTFWQSTYWCGSCGAAPTDITVEHTAPRFGRTPQEAYDDVPTFYSHWGSKTQDGSNPPGDGWNTTSITPRPADEPQIPAPLRWSGSSTGSFAVSSSIADGSTLSGVVPWTATPSGKTASSVTFSTGDYSFLDSDATAPFETSLDTTRFPNGTYTFQVDAIATDGSTASATTTATISNPTATPLSVEQNLADGQAVSGSISWAATTSGKTVARVEYSANGKLVATDSSAPYAITFDTTQLPNGSYPFAVRAVAADGTTATATATVTVSNATASSLSVQQNLVDGQMVSSAISWAATTSGKDVSRVEYSANGMAVATDTSPPYDVTFDTTQLPNGSYPFAVKAVATDGTTATATATVSVANTTPTGISVTQNVRDGLILSGTYDWSATPVGTKITKVSFYIDGKKVATKPRAPYTTSVDTREQPDGTHEFEVIAQSGDGSSASASANVLIANQAASATSTPAVSDNSSGAPSKSGSGTSSTSASPGSTTAAGSQSGGSSDGGSATGAGGSTSESNTPSNSTSTPTDASERSGNSATAPGSNRGLDSNIEDGDTISGLVTWTVNPRGFPVARIEFFIDSKLMWTEQRAPYVYGGDRRQLDAGVLTQGQHELTVRAIGDDGSELTLVLHVTVA